MSSTLEIRREEELLDFLVSVHEHLNLAAPCRGVRASTQGSVLRLSNDASVLAGQRGEHCHLPPQMEYFVGRPAWRLRRSWILARAQNGSKTLKILYRQAIGLRSVIGYALASSDEPNQGLRSASADPLRMRVDEGKAAFTSHVPVRR